MSCLAIPSPTGKPADAPPVDDDLVEIAERVSRATLCLETALALHGLIDAIPAAIDIAVPRRQR
jgi:predicted transcriptional regulator of viral defense system